MVQSSDAGVPDGRLPESSMDGNNEEVAYDDVHGGTLPTYLVKSARKKELRYLQERSVYRYATVADCLRCTGRKPLGLKWIDTNKGSVNAPEVRSRLVCQEIRLPGKEPIFAATPPLDTFRALMIKASSKWGRSRKELTVQIIDVSRAHFYADSIRDVFVKLPSEDPRSSEQGLC